MVIFYGNADFRATWVIGIALIWLKVETPRMAYNVLKTQHHTLTRFWMANNCIGFCVTFYIMNNNVIMNRFNQLSITEQLNNKLADITQFHLIKAEIYFVISVCVRLNALKQVNRVWMVNEWHYLLETIQIEMKMRQFSCHSNHLPLSIRNKQAI